MEKESFYIIGICGVATGSVALLLRELGHEVKGSDQSIYPPMCDVLTKNGINILSGFNASNIKDFHGTVIIGNAISRGNPEVEEVLNLGLRFVSWPEIIREKFLWNQKALVVTGTHGKTTTTAMLTWILDQCGMSPSFLIGGVPNNYPVGYRYSPDGEYFILEGDEYDTAFFDKRSKFLHYLPKGLIINNVEYDHADIFENLEAVKLSFSRLLRIIPQKGILIVNGEDPNVRDVVVRGWTEPQFFGRTSGCNWLITDESFKDGYTEFRLNLIKEEQKVETQNVKIYMAGDHNVMNATAAIAMARGVGVPLQKAAEALTSFKGVRRRMDRIVETDELVIFEDFAKHPSNVKATLNSVRTLYPKSRIWAIFEPRTNTIVRNVFQKELVNAFSDADFVVIGKIYRSQNYKDDERLDVQKLIEDLKNAGKKAYYLENVNDIIQYIKNEKQKGDRIVIMSSGAFDGLPNLCTQAFGGSKPKESFEMITG